jgi:hypothetical protein
VLWVPSDVSGTWSFREAEFTVAPVLPKPQSLACHLVESSLFCPPVLPRGSYLLYLQDANGKTEVETQDWSQYSLTLSCPTSEPSEKGSIPLFSLCHLNTVLFAIGCFPCDPEMIRHWETLERIVSDDQPKDKKWALHMSRWPDPVVFSQIHYNSQLSGGTELTMC